MPPNKYGICDSCNEKSDLLIPIWAWDETSCGDMMIEKFYCMECFAIRIEIDEEKRDKEDADRKEEPKEP